MNKQPKRQFKPVKAWGGFVDGGLHDTLEYYGDRPKLRAVYYFKADAEKYYEDVRPVLIQPLPTPKETKKKKK